MDNAQRFLNSFVRIEMHLKQELGVTNAKFSVLLAQSSKKNSFVQSQRVFLEEMAQLRNAIVHSRVGEEDAIIAEPHLDIVERLERVASHITAPTQLRELKAHDVVIVTPDLTFKEVLTLQKDTGFSVLPVYKEDTYLGCINAALIVAFLQQSPAVLDCEAVRVSDILKLTESTNRVVFLSETHSVNDALSIYDTMHTEGKSLVAILVTKNGYPSEKPSRIFTLADFPQFFEALE